MLLRLLWTAVENPWEASGPSDSFRQRQGKTMAGPDPEEIEFYDKSMISLGRFFEGNDTYQAGIHQNIDAAPCKSPMAPAHFWPASTSTLVRLSPRPLRG